MSTTSKPQNLPTIDLSSTGVDVLSPPPNDTDIVIAGDPVSFQLNLSVTGQVMVVAMYANEPVEVSHHIENVEDGSRFTLGPFPFTTPGTVAGLASFNFTTGPFTTSVNGGGGQFQLAAGDDDAVYRVVTEFHFTGVAESKANSVFDDRLLAITSS